MNVTFAGSTPPFPPCTISINGYYVVRRTTFSALDQEQIDGCARGRRGATRCAWIFRICWVVGDRHACYSRNVFLSPFQEGSSLDGIVSSPHLLAQRASEGHQFGAKRHSLNRFMLPSSSQSLSVIFHISGPVGNGMRILFSFSRYAYLASRPNVE